MGGLFIGRPVFLSAKAFYAKTGVRVHFPLHRHEHNMELLFIADGQSDYEIDGKSYRARAGDIVLFHPNVWHEEHSLSDHPFTFYYVGFHSLQIKGLPPNWLTEAEEAPIFSALARYDRIKSLFDQLMDEADAGWNGSLSGVQSLLELLLLEVHRTLRMPMARKRSFAHVAIAQIRRIMEERYYESLTIRELADAVYTSPSYVSHLFREHVGESPIQFLIRLRVSAAKRYLSTTDLSLEQIAERVGYGSPTSFQNVFKKTTGLTPGRYRKKESGRNHSR